MRNAPVVSVLWASCFTLVATPIAHALVEDAVVRPSLASSQRAWLNCALSTAEHLHLNSEPTQSPATIADRALTYCYKGEELVEDAMRNSGKRSQDYNKVTQMRAKLREALIEHLEQVSKPGPTVAPSGRH